MSGFSSHLQLSLAYFIFLTLLFDGTMVYEIRASADMIRANRLFSAVGWKEWGRKKDRKWLFPTPAHQPAA